MLWSHLDVEYVKIFLTHWIFTGLTHLVVGVGIGVGGGAYWIHLVRSSVDPSLRLSVDGFVSALYVTFERNSLILV